MRSSSPRIRLSVRALLACMVLAALLPVTAILARDVYEDLRAERDRTENELVRAAAGFSQAVDRELASSVDALHVLAESELFQQGRIAAMGRLLQGRPRRDWDSIFLLDANGAVVLDTAPKPAPPASLQGIHAQALIGLKPVVSGVGSSAHPGITIAIPITQGGHPIYVLKVRTSDVVWNRLAANAVTAEGAQQARLYDSARQLISQSGASAADDGRVYTACADTTAAGWHACVATPAEPIDAQRRETILHALKTSGVALLVGLILAGVFARVVLARVD